VAQSGSEPPRYWAFSITRDVPESAGLLCGSDQLVAGTSTWHHTTHNRQTSTPPAEFEPTISVDEQTQTYALDRGVSGRGARHYTWYICINKGTPLHRYKLGRTRMNLTF
jgi:hypothetical protein